MKKKYQPIYDTYSRDDRGRENKEDTQSPPSSEHSPVHVRINAERSPHSVASTAKGLDLDALDNMQQMPGRTVNVKSLEKKPWRRAGADISDYFNYGFDEESWNAYCKKQTKLHAANTKLYAKIPKGNNRHGEEELCYSFSGSSSILASRKSTASTDVTEGQSGSSRRVEGWWLSDKENSTQVITEMSPQEDKITSCHLTLPSNFSSLFAYTPQPPFLYRREPNPPPPNTALDSGHAKKCEASSTSHYPFPSGVSSSVPWTMASRAWEFYIWQKRCDKERGRSREHGHDKNSKRSRNRKLESCSSRNSSISRSRRSRKDDGGDRKSQNRHKHKKTKRNGKDKETNKMLCPDNEENQI